MFRSDTFVELNQPGPAQPTATILTRTQVLSLPSTLIMKHYSIKYSF